MSYGEMLTYQRISNLTCKIRKGGVYMSGEYNISSWEISGEELENLVDMSECALFIVKPGAELELVYANKRFYTILKCEPDYFEKKYDNHLMSVILPDEKQKIRALVARQSAAGGTLQLEFRITRADGVIAWISMTARIAIADGETLYYCSCLDVTNTRKSIDDVYRAKREVDVISNSIPGGMLKLRVSDWKILYANDGYYLLSGYSRTEFHLNFDDKAYAIVHPLDVDMVKSIVSSAAKTQGLMGFECRIVARNGDTKWIYVNGRQIDDDGSDIVYLCVIMDITAKKQIEKDVEDFAKGSDLLSDFRRESSWIYDMKTGNVNCNGGLGEGMSKEHIVAALFDVKIMQDMMHPDDMDSFLAAFSKRTSTIGQSRNRYRLKDERGNYRVVDIYSISVEADEDGKPTKVYGLIQNMDQEVTLEERKKSVDLSMTEQRLFNLAKVSQSKSDDGVTGMLPYAAFVENAEKALKQRREDEHFALICADINEFRKFMHNYGFSISNRILQAFSDVLKDTIAKEGICSRVDGDYFVVLFKYLSHKELLRAMSSVVRSQQEINENESYPNFGTTSGVYLVQPEDTELSDILGKADLARRSIKGLAGNHYAIYTEDLEQQRFREEEIIEEIIEAMRNRSVEICYLPRICNTKENVVGCKAVARVQLKSGEYIESDRLLRYIERGGSLDEFAFSILDSVCSSISAWQRKGYKPLPISIEMTAGELSMRNAVNDIDDIVRMQNRIEPDRIIIELQERFFAEMTASFEMALEKLLQLGYKVVITRFGSDHTALHTLRNLPVTGIKFHGEYFNDMTSDKEKLILQKLVETVKVLGMKVACGGIHTKLQEEYAKEIGCDLFEGDIYYGAVRNNVFEKCFLEGNDNE